MLRLKNRVLVIWLAVLSVLVTSCTPPAQTTSNEVVTVQSEQQTTTTDKDKTQETTNNLQQEEAEDQTTDKTYLQTSAEVHFIDTGNSDSILISDNGKYMIIDGADNNDEEMLVDYIRNLNIKKIDYVVLTHPDADHSGGLDAIIEHFDIGQVFIGNGSSNSKTYNDFLDAAINKNLEPSVPLVGSTFQLGEGTFTFYNQKSHYEDVNDNSLITLYTCGNTKFLFTGDAGKEVEEKLPLSEIGKVDVLKVGHHGSKTSSSDVFIRAVSPVYSIICAGRDNKYGHPHQVTLDTLEKYGSLIYRTDIHGTIIAKSNGDSVHLSYKKADSDDHATANKKTSDGENKQAAGNTIQDKAQSSERISSDKNKTSSGSEDHLPMVYVTNTGKKYHRDGCKSLKKSKIAISLSDAQSQGYEPCGICNP